MPKAIYDYLSTTEVDMKGLVIAATLALSGCALFRPPLDVEVRAICLKNGHPVGAPGFDQCFYEMMRVGERFYATQGASAAAAYRNLSATGAALTAAGQARPLTYAPPEPIRFPVTCHRWGTTTTCN
jgi:hypothetical protein